MNLEKHDYFNIFLKSLGKVGHVPLCPSQDPQLYATDWVHQYFDLQSNSDVYNR